MPRAARLRRAAAAALAIVFAAQAAHAEEVTLRDGAEVVATGELLGYDGRYYRLLGAEGEMTLDGTELDCEGAACPGNDWIEALRISGEAAILEEILPPLLSAYAGRREHALERNAAEERVTYTFRSGEETVGRVVLHPTSSAEGLADIVADAADLAVTLRPPSPVEADLARQAGRGDLTAPGRSAILALDAVVPVASLDNPVTSIGIESLGGILAGEIDDWSDLGGPSGPVRLHLPAPRTGLGEAIASELAIGDGVAVFHDDPAAIAAAVGGDVGALGLTLLSARGETQPLVLSGPCGTETLATPLAVKTADYPLSLPIFLYAPARRLGPFARDLVDYLTSPLAQPVIRRTGRIDQFPEAIPFSAQGDRLVRGILSAEGAIDLATLKRMVATLKDGARLSLSFRFGEGAAALNAQSAANVALLAEALERGVFRDRRLVFAGFSDGLGPSGTNRSLSRQRALAVREAVRARLGETRATLSVGAYGEALPLACDETLWGRRANRRVEVWLR